MSERETRSNGARRRARFVDETGTYHLHVALSREEHRLLTLLCEAAHTSPAPLVRRLLWSQARVVGLIASPECERKPGKKPGPRKQKRAFTKLAVEASCVPPSSDTASSA